MTTTPRPRWVRTLIVVLAVAAGACGDDSDRSNGEQSLPGPEDQAGRLCTDASGGPVGTLGNPELDELSGAAASRIHDGLWAHNDKGDDARIFGLGLDGSDAGVWELTGVEATDWEDIAVGPGPDPDASYIHVADIGDNRGRRDTIAVHRFVEPNGWGDGGRIDEVDSFMLRYPDGAHDAEAFLVDPISGDWFIIVKADGSERPPVYRATPTENTDTTVMLEQVATIDRLVTAADVTSDGNLVALRTLGGVVIHPRPLGTPLEAAFATTPCRAPTTDAPKGEALAFVGLDRYVTISEGQGAAVDVFVAE